MPTDGTHVLDVDSTTAALAYGDLFDSADELLSAVDEDDLDTVVSELADALRGRGDELHDLIGRSAEVTSTFAARTRPRRSPTAPTTSGCSSTRWLPVRTT